MTWSSITTISSSPLRRLLRVQCINVLRYSTGWYKLFRMKYIKSRSLLRRRRRVLLHPLCASLLTTLTYPVCIQMTRLDARLQPTCHPPTSRCPFLPTPAFSLIRVTRAPTPIPSTSTSPTIPIFPRPSALILLFWSRPGTRRESRR